MQGMTSGNPALVELIRAKIQNHGPQSFTWFMQQALYHPKHGYYSSGRCAIGRRGDYFTNVSVGPLFGQVLAAQFAEMWERLGKIDNFVIVEQGVHHGDFAHDVLESVRKRRPDFFGTLRYQIIEPFPVLKDRQSLTLAEFGDKIEWRASIDALEPFTGVHFSNELLDSMPVHLIVSAETKPGSSDWREKFVTLNGDVFAFVDQPIGDRKLREHLKALPVRPAGFQTESNLAALEWVENVSRKLNRGYVLTIDYGHPREEFHAPHRSAGTLQVRAQHRLLLSPFDEVGCADITAHVDWTSIAERAEACGLQVAGFTDQHHFITGIISTWPELLPARLLDSTALSSRVRRGDVDTRTKRALQTLLHPEMLGRSFQVLALGKAVDPGARIAGFKFAREPRSALGLCRA
jgi:SAM-dependent MidA family methyltransferase